MLVQGVDLAEALELLLVDGAAGVKGIEEAPGRLERIRVSGEASLVLPPLVLRLPGHCSVARPGAFQARSPAAPRHTSLRSVRLSRLVGHATSLSRFSRLLHQDAQSGSHMEELLLPTGVIRAIPSPAAQ